MGGLLSILESIRGLIYGAKELKLNKEKRDSYYKDILLHNEFNVLKADKRGHSIISAAMSYGDLICFFVIGVVAFILVNYQSISQSELISVISVIMVLLYITGPVSVIIDFVPEIMQARISLVKVNKLLEELPSENVERSIKVLPQWQSIEFDSVTFKHTSNKSGQNFQVGPVSFSLKKGQITFLVGGNGAGKSTLSKLITLHYIAHSGSIRFGDTEVSGESINSCREHISAIYSDYYLFDRLLGTLNSQHQKLAETYLTRLGLDKKVFIIGGKFSTTSLSDGQRRRLALLVSFLENKDVYVFDEWAADQDPTFKDIFYNQILQELKSKNKVVLVISHDDRYFELADQLLFLENGLVCEDKSSLDKSDLSSEAVSLTQNELHFNFGKY